MINKNETTLVIGFKYSHSLFSLISFLIEQEKEIILSSQTIKKLTLESVMNSSTRPKKVFYFYEPSIQETFASILIDLFAFPKSLKQTQEKMQSNQLRVVTQLEIMCQGFQFLKKLTTPIFKGILQSSSILPSLPSNYRKQTFKKPHQEPIIIEKAKFQMQLQNCHELLAQINKNSQTFNQKLCQEFDNEEEFKQYLKAYLPDNAILIGNNSEYAHCLILENKTNIYVHHGKTIQELVYSTKSIWQRFRIDEEIRVGENEKEIIEKARESLKQLQDLQINLSECIPEDCENFSQFVEHIYRSYTSDYYHMINLASTSKNAVFIHGIRYLFQILIANHRMKIVGQQYFSNSPLYRKITLQKQLLQLYKINEIIYFTNLTSTSKKFGISVPQCYYPGSVQVQFIIQLLGEQQQRKNRFYSGLDISQYSQFPYEEEVIIYPFQFFRISQIVQGEKRWLVFLQELESKQIIEKIEESGSGRKRGERLQIGRVREILEERIWDLTEKLEAQKQEKDKLKPEYQ